MGNDDPEADSPQATRFLAKTLQPSFCSKPEHSRDDDDSTACPLSNAALRRTDLVLRYGPAISNSVIIASIPKAIQTLPPPLRRCIQRASNFHTNFIENTFQGIISPKVAHHGFRTATKDAIPLSGPFGPPGLSYRTWRMANIWRPRRERYARLLAHQGKKMTS